MNSDFMWEVIRNTESQVLTLDQLNHNLLYQDNLEEWGNDFSFNFNFKIYFVVFWPHCVACGILVP